MELKLGRVCGRALRGQADLVDCGPERDVVVRAFGSLQGLAHDTGCPRLAGVAHTGFSQCRGNAEFRTVVACGHRPDARPFRQFGYRIAFASMYPGRAKVHRQVRPCTAGVNAATGAFARLEHGHCMALLRQCLCCRQPGDAGADDHDRHRLRSNRIAGPSKDQCTKGGNHASSVRHSLSTLPCIAASCRTQRRIEARRHRWQGLLCRHAFVL